MLVLYEISRAKEFILIFSPDRLCVAALPTRKPQFSIES